jgi:hypothetical protein
VTDHRSPDDALADELMSLHQQYGSILAVVLSAEFQELRHAALAEGVEHSGIEDIIMLFDGLERERDELIRLHGPKDERR